MNNNENSWIAEITLLKGSYYPAEDSILLSQAVKFEKGTTILDMGCGSGIQSINAVKHGAQKVLAVDISETALKNTLLNAKKFGMLEKISVQKSNLFELINEQFDAIIFNPPYVETKEKKSPDIDGGKNGREVLDDFLEKFGSYLKKGGTCFFLQSTLNGLKKTEKILTRKKFGFKIVARKKLFFEELVVFRAWKKI